MEKFRNDTAKGPFTLSDSKSESEKDQRTIGKDQSVSGKISKKMFIFAIAQCKWALRNNFSMKSIQVELEVDIGILTR